MPTEAGMWNLAWAEWLIEELVRQGVGAFFISPGSRSAPLTAAAARNPRARTFVHFDERGAGFAAVGFAKAAGRPAALIGTSGTAAANYFPAIVEASQSHTPLLIITADRPPELIDAGVNQTIDQTRLYGAYPRWRADMPCPSPDVPAEYVLTTAAQAVYRATRPPAGPVHLNCRFREPLLPDTPLSTPASLETWASQGLPYTHYPAAPQHPSDAALDALQSAIAPARRGLLIVGALNSRPERDAVREVARALNWPTFADSTSGLRLGNPQPPFVPQYPLLLAGDFLSRAPKPDVVVHIGGPITAKRLQTYLRDAHPPIHVRVAAHPNRVDPDHGITLRVEAGIEHACQAMGRMPIASPDMDWAASIFTAAAQIERCVDECFAQDHSLSEPAVARLLSRHLAADAALFLGNSMPIRDMDTFASPHGAEVPVFANRGASGIDGNVCTAAGIALGLDCPVTAAMGDLALLHDINGLALLKQTPVVLVVLNNDGGGIFHFLPVAKHADIFEPFFVAPHGLRFEHAARMFGIEYAAPTDATQFAQAYAHAIQKRVGAIIEVQTIAAENLRTHTALEGSVRRAGKE